MRVGCRYGRIRLRMVSRIKLVRVLHAFPSCKMLILSSYSLSIKLRMFCSPMCSVASRCASYNHSVPVMHRFTDLCSKVGVYRLPTLRLERIQRREGLHMGCIHLLPQLSISLRGLHDRYPRIRRPLRQSRRQSTFFHIPTVRIPLKSHRGTLQSLGTFFQVRPYYPAFRIV